MKKKILLTLTLVAVFACLFAIAISAAPIAGYQQYEVELVDGSKITVYESAAWDQWQGRLNFTDATYTEPPLDTENTYPLLDWSQVVVADFTNGKRMQLNATTSEYVETYGTNGGFSMFLSSTSFTKANAINLKKVITGNATVVLGGSLNKLPALEEVVCGEKLKEIGWNAFDDNKKLTKIDFSACQNFTTFGNQVFKGCTALTTFNIPNTLTSLGESVFSGCTSLKTINWPTQLTTIPNGTFEGCSSLVFEIPSYITKIGSSAFKNCDSFTVVNIPANVTSVGNYAFSSCDNLTTIDFADNSQATGKFIGIAEYCPKLTSFEFPSGVTALGYDNFRGCTTLAELDISRITEITGGNNFNSTAITKLVFSNELTSLPGNNTNSLLEEVRFGANIKSISSGSFNLKNIKRIYLPATLETLGGNILGWSNSADSASNITFIFTGTKEQAEALQTYYEEWTLANQPTYVPNSSKFYDATLVSAKDYDVTQEPVGFHLVYDYSACDAFYNGTHQEKAPYNAFKGDKYITDFCQYADCNRCTNTVETKLHGPLFISKGYSKSADAFMFDMKVDFDAIAEYEALGGTVPSYGLVVSANAAISELIGLDGNVVDTSVLKVNFDEGSYNNVQVKLNNILTDTSKAMKIHACAYIIDSESVYYVGEGKATTASTMICHNDIQGEEEVTPEETPAE
ncbi:MAG: leucine-rich repeat domain-containing protein [Ruminococcaceae bacterium]|nr:leucine-rich repeat domain-containing protein [Oscillospiraceae bacterium]